MPKKIDQIIKILHEGGIIIYPTEGVYGIGCDPFNETAVKRLLKIKKRHVNKGLILIASDWRQVENLIRLDLKKYPVIRTNKDHPTTWVFPATRKAPRWIIGKYNSIAIRVTSHPLAKKICQKFGGPIVSTSANLTNKPPVKTYSHAQKYFKASVDLIVRGQLGGLKKSTQICDVVTGKILRS